MPRSHPPHHSSGSPSFNKIKSKREEVFPLAKKEAGISPTSDRFKGMLASVLLASKVKGHYKWECLCSLGRLHSFFFSFSTPSERLELFSLFLVCVGGSISKILRIPFLSIRT